MRRLLLLSTSTLHGSGYLDYAMDELADFLGTIERLLFVPFALADRASYVARVRARFALAGYAVDGLQENGDPRHAIDHADAIFVGGGNTFRLLKALQDLRLLDSIRQRVADGMAYIGSSAGSNIAAPTIKTTNDMPIVEPRSFKSLGLVSFQINPHYLDPDPQSTHMGETREARILQFLEENNTPVIGLREGACLRIEGGACELRGAHGARLFRHGQVPAELSPGRIDQLLNT